MFYAKLNHHGSSTSVGFANTWQVVGFDTKAARDLWLRAHADRLDAEAITADEARRLASPYNRQRARRGGLLADVVFVQDDAGALVRMD